MILELQQIGPDGFEVERDLAIGSLTGPDRARIRVRGARIAAEAKRGRRGVDFRGKLAAEVELPCDRCLEPHWTAVATDFSLVLVPEAVEFGAGEIRVHDDDADLFYVKDGKVTLEAVATEQLHLSLPLKAVCREDCKGLCRQCGTNLNDGTCGCEAPVDPRLAPLLKFRQQLED